MLFTLEHENVYILYSLNIHNCTTMYIFFLFFERKKQQLCHLTTSLLVFLRYY